MDGIQGVPNRTQRVGIST